MQTLYECNITLCIYSPLRNSFDRVASNNRVIILYLSRNNNFLNTQPRIISYFNSFILIPNWHILMIVSCITISIVIKYHSTICCELCFILRIFIHKLDSSIYWKLLNAVTWYCHLHENIFLFHSQYKLDIWSKIEFDLLCSRFCISFYLSCNPHLI